MFGPSKDDRGLGVVIVCLLVGMLGIGAVAHGFSSFDLGAPNGRRGLAVTPTNPLTQVGSALLRPREQESIPLSSRLFQGIIPEIPNLRFGWVYNFGKKFSRTSFQGDYFIPVSLNRENVIFAQAHVASQDFWKTIAGDQRYRVDFSVGGGYRKIVRDRLMVGVNGFYDGTRLTGNWYSSGGAGLELKYNLAGSDFGDLSFNYYGNFFNGRHNIIDAFRDGPANYDVEAGYSHALLHETFDLRLKLRGYQFDSGAKVYGWSGGFDLTTHCRMLKLTYEIAHDPLNGTYHTVAARVTTGFDIASLLTGNNPFTPPKPIYSSPPNMYTESVSDPVNRQWSPADQAVLAAGSQCAILRTIGSHTFLFDSGFPNATDPEDFTLVDVGGLSTVKITINWMASYVEPPGFSLIVVSLENSSTSQSVVVGTFDFLADTTPFMVTVPVPAFNVDRLRLTRAGGSPDIAVDMTWDATLCFN